MVTAVAEFPHVAIHHQATPHPTPTTTTHHCTAPASITHRVTQIRTQGMSFLTHFPFTVQHHLKKATAIPTGCPYSSAPTNSWLLAIPLKPFSTLVLKRLTRVIATTTKICTTGCSTLGLPTQLPHSPCASSYLSQLSIAPVQKSIVVMIEKYWAQLMIGTEASSIFGTHQFGR